MLVQPSQRVALDAGNRCVRCACGTKRTHPGSVTVATFCGAVIAKPSMGLEAPDTYSATAAEASGETLKLW